MTASGRSRQFYIHVVVCKSNGQRCATTQFPTPLLPLMQRRILGQCQSYGLPRSVSLYLNFID